MSTWQFEMLKTWIYSLSLDMAIHPLETIWKMLKIAFKCVLNLAHIHTNKFRRITETNKLHKKRPYRAQAFEMTRWHEISTKGRQKKNYQSYRCQICCSLTHLQSHPTHIHALPCCHDKLKIMEEGRN